MAKEKLKVSILSFYSGEISRGVETYVHELGNELVRLGHDVTVFQNGGKIDTSKYKTVSTNLPIKWNTKNVNTPFISYWALLVKTFTQKVLSEINSDTDVVLTTNGQWQSVLVRKWVRKNDARHVISGQSGLGIDDRINLATTPDAFIALTEYQKKWATSAVPLINNRIEKISNGVDVDKFNAKKKINFNLPRPIVLNVSALENNKRQELSIRAVSKLSEGSLLLVGKGSNKKELQKLGSELLPGRFAIREFAYEYMPSVYNSVDLFTFPTVPWESFGIVMLEAMAAGLPIVASDDPIRREIVGNAGLFVNPMNTDEYANKLENALKKEWKGKPRQQAKKFSWDSIAKKYEELFINLTTENKV